MLTVILTGWVVLGLAMAVAEVVGVLSDGRFPTLGDVLAFLMRPRFGRWLPLRRPPRAPEPSSS